MKKLHLINYLCVLLTCFGLMMFSSCEKLSLPGAGSEEQSQSGEKTSVKIKTRSASSDALQYPITVYAFNSQGTCVSTQTITSAGSELNMSLASGKYHLVAVGCGNGYDLPSTVGQDALVTCSNDDNVSDCPLQLGQADISVGSTSVSATIIMANKASKLSVALSDVPSDVSAVSVTISNQYSQMSLQGEGVSSTAKSSTVNLTKSGGTWYSDTFYTLSGAGRNTVVTIALTTSSGTSSYGYTYSSALDVNTPYNINGSYSDGMVAMTGQFQAQSWLADVDLNFSFGPNGSTNGTISGEDDIPSVDSKLPTAGSIYKGYLIASIEPSSDTEAEAMLLSLDEWTGLVSAYNATDPDEAANISAGYSEGVVTDWSIPTSDEAKLLKSTFNGETLQALNDVIKSAGGTPVSEEEDSGSNARYLCEDATYTFAFKASTQISKAGATVKTYRLRLVAYVHISL